MNAKMIDLAVRAAACKGWRWIALEWRSRRDPGTPSEELIEELVIALEGAP